MNTGNFKNRLLITAFCSSTAFVGSVVLAGEQETDVPPLSTPPGITLIRVEREPVYDVSSPLPPRHLWTRLGDADGNTLFVSDQDTVPGTSHCVDECAQTFPPVLALPGSKEAGSWTLVERKQGKQWAYNGKPLYRFARETRLNEVVNNILDEQFKDNLQEQLESRGKTGKKDHVLMPPEGWSIARFDPRAATPPGIDIHDIPAISGLGFVDRNGKTVYAREGDSDDFDSLCAGCDNHWQPLAAPGLSSEVGRFKPVTRSNGDRQWSYNGALLYTYSGDYEPGEVNGTDLSEQATAGGVRLYVPMLARHYMPPGILVRKDMVRGRIFSTSNGMPLYSRYPFERKFGKRGQLAYSYRKGKEIGTKGCNAECLETWHPLLAPDNAQPRGFWEVVVREDGSRQWAYRGFVQYININDKPYKKAIGNFRFDYVMGDSGPYKPEDAVVSGLQRFFPTAFFWHLSAP